MSLFILYSVFMQPLSSTSVWKKVILAPASLRPPPNELILIWSASSWMVSLSRLPATLFFTPTFNFYILYIHTCSGQNPIWNMRVDNTKNTWKNLTNSLSNKGYRKDSRLLAWENCHKQSVQSRRSREHFLHRWTHVEVFLALFIPGINTRLGWSNHKWTFCGKNVITKVYRNPFCKW